METNSGKRTNVISKREILSHLCPNCFARPKALCLDTRGRPRELAHPERIRAAQEKQSLRLFGEALDNSEKALVLYYGFIMLCDSVSTRAREMFGSEFTSEQIQTFFCKQAIVELQNDGLLKRYVQPTNVGTDSKSGN